MADHPGHRWPKRIRLERRLYETPHQTVSVTINCRNRVRCFEHRALVSDCLESLEFASTQRSISVLVYCFMPDHLHLLVQPRNHDSNIIEFVQRYKSYTGRLAWKHGFDGNIWQPRFYDHILREYEDPAKHLRYIIENPVRADLVDTWNEYPFTGSFEFNLEEFDW